MLLEAGIWECSNREYHQDRTCVSHSALEVFRKSVQLYAAKYVFGTIDNEPATESLLVGNAVHCLIFESDSWDDLFAVYPEGDGRTKAVKEARERFAAEVGDRTILTKAQADLAFKIFQGIQSNPLAWDLLNREGQSEQAIRWDRDGIWLKCKPDKLLQDGTILDLKTTRDPVPYQFSRSVANYGYHRQAALYLQGRDSVFGESRAPHIIIACGNVPPYECVVYQLETEAIAHGAAQNAADLYQLGRCRDTMDWRGPWDNVVNKLSVPRWELARED